jgi:hypothetical protein
MLKKFFLKTLKSVMKGNYFVILSKAKDVDERKGK